MSSPALTQNDIARLDQQLNEAVLRGEIMAAFEQFYAENVVMQENNAPPTSGKAENRKREQDFVNSVEQFHGARLLSSAVNGDLSFSEWELDATYKGAGRVLLSQVAVRRWRDGKVISERFYYNKG
ncbi:MAG TPA: nuclear transport factor 2 family protein [Bryobacteraceae bacterium]|nr:nuclear transport factor 2 family protein [Bryobacteraceae bacterium]